MTDSVSNPFAAPGDLKATAVIWRPSRLAYDALRIGHIVAAVAVAWLLFRTFRVAPSWDWITAINIACSGTVLLATIWIVMRELWAYWTDDVQRERRILFIHAAYSLTFCALIGIVHFSGTASQRHVTLLPLVFVAAWHISVILRSSMLRQKAQFIEAQQGVATSRSFLSIDASNPSELESWEVEGSRVEKASSSDHRVRLKSLTAWIRGSLLNRRGFITMGCVLGLCVGGVAATRYLIPVEVAHYEVGCDGDWFEASLNVKRGNLFAECHDAQWLRNADGSWRRDELVKEVRIGSSPSIMMSNPSIQFDVNAYLFTFHADNRIIAHYDCRARQFQVNE